MAEKTVLVDDITGELGATTIGFGVEEWLYEIDAAEGTRRALHEALEPFMEAGRMVSGPRSKPKPRPRKAPAARKASPKVDPETLEAAREWARANGYRVADRGRIPARVMAAFEAAHTVTPKSA